MELLEKQRKLIPGIAIQHPDITGFASSKLNQYWYVESGGVATKWTKEIHQEYDMETKLADKDLKNIKDLGQQDANLEIQTPFCVDMDIVKKEHDKLKDLEQLLKECQPA